MWPLLKKNKEPGMFEFGAWCAQVRRFRERFLGEYCGNERRARAHFLQGLVCAVLKRYSAHVEISHLTSQMTALDEAVSWSTEAGDALALSADELDALAAAPTLIGWSYQIWNEVDRDATTWGVSYKGEQQAERLSIVAATQIFTEEYMADFLAERCHALLDEKKSSYTVMDPACGAGHLLARVFRLLFREVGNPSAVEQIVTRLYGCDIDPEAVYLSRAVILLESLRAAPEAAFQVVAALNQNVFVLEKAIGVLDASGAVAGLARHYDCVIANPPYLGRRKLTQQMRDLLTKEYPESALDLCAAVARRCIELTAPEGVTGLVTSDRWLRLKGYREFRSYLCGAMCIDVVAELGDRAFRSQLDLHDGVRVVLTVGRRSSKVHDHSVQYLSAVSQRELDSKATYLACHYSRNEEAVTLSQAALRDDTDGAVFLGVAGAPHALQTASTRLAMHAQIVVGLQTNDDGAFVRYHWQVVPDSARWCPHNKGGGYARWFGLNRWVLDKRPESMVRYSSGSSGGCSLEEWFSREGWTYSWFANGCLGVRRKESGWSFGRATSSGLFCDDLRIIAYCNSRLASLCTRLIGGKIQLPEGVVRQIAVPDDLSAVEPALVEAAVEIKKQIVSADPTEVTFAPAGRPSLAERWLLEALLLTVEGELERQVMESARMSTAERQQVAGVIAEPVALRYGLPSERSCNQIRPLIPKQWQPLFEALTSRAGVSGHYVGEGGEVFLRAHEGIERMLRGLSFGRSSQASFPAVGPIERISAASGVHPIDVIALLESYLHQHPVHKLPVLVEEYRQTLLVEVLKALGFCWYTERDEVREARQLSSAELFAELGALLDIKELEHVLQRPLLAWIEQELEPWHRKLLLNAPILQRREDDGVFQASCER